MPVIISGAQERTKDSYAPASDIGLMLRANGEEKVKVIDAKTNVVTAGLPAPTVAPSAADGGAGNLTNGKWVAYEYVYAATERYPFVVDSLAINGSEAPRSNPSPFDSYEITGAGDRQVDVTVTYTTRADISEIWIFRTSFWDTQQEAETAAEAGLLFFVGSVANNTAGGTTVFTDDVLAPVDQIGLDNYEAPQFKYTVYDGKYFWGWGNEPLSLTATWDNSHTGSTGLITLDADQGSWFDGRDGQNITLSGITTGGYDGQGTFRFLWLTSTTATVYTTDSSTPVALPSTGSGTVTIQGPATTLYRSKAYNPFAWGYTEIIGTAQVPRQFGERVGGGIGTAMAIVPNEELLVLCTRYPSRTFTFNLGASDSTDFFATKRTVSTIYSYTSHFSVFNARVGATNVLWGMDYENLEVLQCDGVRMVPVLQEVSPVLRLLTSNRSRQLQAHGAYDPGTQANCLWVTTSRSLTNVNLGIFQDTKTGAVSIREEQDLLSSAVISDTISNKKKIVGGTQTGYYGEILVPSQYGDWTNAISGLKEGTVSSATSTTITTTSGTFANDSGMVGNWCLVTDADGNNEIWCRISGLTSDTLTFDAFSGNQDATDEFETVPSAGWRFYVGVIDVRLTKYFDMNAPVINKQLMEHWLSMENASNTVVKFLPERSADPVVTVQPYQEVYKSSGMPDKDTWVVRKGQFAEPTKVFGFQIVNRNYEAFRFFNTTVLVKDS